MKDRNSLKSELTIALTKAAEQSFLALFSEHPESFYYCSYIMAEYGSPFICAWSKEALRRLIKSLNLKDKEQRQAEKELYKWSYADSPYVAYGVEKYFKEVQDLYNTYWDHNAADEEYDQQCVLWLDCMEDAMRALDEKELFGSGTERNRKVVLAEIMPPDYSNTERAYRLNPKKALKSWLDEAAEEKDEISEKWRPSKVLLIKPVSDIKTTVRLRMKFSCNIPIKEFVHLCNNPPVVLREDIKKCDAEKILYENPDLCDYVSIRKMK